MAARAEKQNVKGMPKVGVQPPVGVSYPRGKDAQGEKQKKQ